MNCPQCNSKNEYDARFCSECGGQLGPLPAAKNRKAYLPVLLLIPVLVLAAAIGYYKYMLPRGVAAVVNGESITVSELNAEVARTMGSPETVDGRVRYQVLNSLISERIILQEARKAGMTVPAEEIARAAANARTGSGLTEAAFKEQVESRYGTMRAFEQMLERRLLINRYIAEKIIPASADPRKAREAFDHWLQARADSAAVRVTLKEQLSGSGGCGCCENKKGGDPAGTAGKNGSLAGSGSALSGPPQQAGRSGAAAAEAADAGLRYWKGKHGPDSVTASVTDYGCHMQVDIIKEGKRVGSLRYQGGVISEQ